MQSMCIITLLYYLWHLFGVKKEQTSQLLVANRPAEAGFTHLYCTLLAAGIPALSFHHVCGLINPSSPQHCGTGVCACVCIRVCF